MCLKILRSIFDLEPSESTEQGRPKGFQGPKTEIISSKIANFSFLSEFLISTFLHPILVTIYIYVI